MTTSKDGTMKRSGSAARGILKRHEKRYKTEQKRVFERRKKLDLHTSYAKPPDGYAFVPVGTPDLSNRCKDLSRQQAYPVHVVNAKPSSKHALNIAKVSHHIHRIGYHFRGEIVEQACEELGYIPHAGKYLKPEDLIKRRQESSISQTLTKYGINMTLSSQTGRESLDQVRAAIKELFPRIPEQDLHSIVKHAWEEGSDRVGTNAEMDLPRRVQLAVIARIRHNYTDYDRLLRAFEWSEARQMVEPECLQKIIEWRGENDEDEDDQELEEIVRETIVIDDDEDDRMAVYGGEADDEDSAEIIDLSDSSIEIITHRIAADDDLGAESMDEPSLAFHSRFLPRRRTVAQRSDIAKQKIGAAKKRIRDGVPARTYASLPGKPHLHAESQPLRHQNQHHFNQEPVRTIASLPLGSQPHLERLPTTPQYFQHHHTSQPQDEVIIEGQRYRRAPYTAAPLPPMQVQPQYRFLAPPQTSPAAPLYRAYAESPAPTPASRGAARATMTSQIPPPHDRPVASIERGNDVSDFGMLDYEPQPPSRRYDPPPGAEIVDLTSPPRRAVYPGPVPHAQEPFVVYGRPSPLGRHVVYQQQPLPQPIHGAPAPIQYRVPGSWPGSPARLHPPPPPPPTNGAVAPTQYYYR